jgi:hypothetical protein
MDSGRGCFNPDMPGEDAGVIGEGLPGEDTGVIGRTASSQCSTQLHCGCAFADWGFI